MFVLCSFYVRLSPTCSVVVRCVFVLSCIIRYSFVYIVYVFGRDRWCWWWMHYWPTTVRFVFVAHSVTLDWLSCTDTLYVRSFFGAPGHSMPIVHSPVEKYVDSKNIISWYGPVKHRQTGWNHQSSRRFGHHRNVFATNMDRIQRTRNEHEWTYSGSVQFNQSCVIELNE